MPKFIETFATNNSKVPNWLYYKFPGIASTSVNGMINGPDFIKRIG